MNANCPQKCHCTAILVYPRLALLCAKTSVLLHQRFGGKSENSGCNQTHQNVGENAGLIWQKHFPPGWQEAWRVSSRPIRVDFLFSVTCLDLEETTTGVRSIVGPAHPASLIREGSLREERSRIKIRKLTDYTCVAIRLLGPYLYFPV